MILSLDFATPPALILVEGTKILISAADTVLTHFAFRGKDVDIFALEYSRVVEKNAAFPAVISEQGEFTHDMFWRFACGIASGLEADGVDENALVAFTSNNLVTVLAMIIATSLRGARLIVAEAAVARAKIGKPSHFYRTAEMDGGKKFQVIDETWLKQNDPDDQQRVLNLKAKPDSDWLCLHTSGTTGREKYFYLTQRMVLERSRARAQDFPFQQTVLASPANVMSRLYWARALGTLLQAGSLIDSFDLEFWRKSGVNLAVGSPPQVFDFFKSDGSPRKFPRAEIGGAKLPDETIRHLLKHFDVIVDSYGAAETNKSFENQLTLGADDTIQRRGVSLDSQVEIISADGKPCAPGEMGTVRVKNPYMIKGYLNSDEATARVFSGGWFHPGDLATWGENQELVIIGRDDDVINLGGYKLNAGFLDMFFSRVTGIKEAIVFQNPKSKAVSKVLILAVFEPDVTKYEVIELACEMARHKLGVLLSPDAFRHVTTIPKTLDGDPDRKACRAMVLKYSQTEASSEDDA